MRNERVIVLFLAYVIGLVTSFIAFYDFDFLAGNQQSVATNTFNDAEFTNTPDNQSGIQNAATVALTEEALVYTHGTATKVIAMAANEYYDPQPGVYQEVHTYKLSPDGTKVLFCESYVPTDTCQLLVYHAQAHLITHVHQRDGQPTAVAVTDVDKFAWENNQEIIYTGVIADGEQYKWNITQN